MVISGKRGGAASAFSVGTLRSVAQASVVVAFTSPPPEWGADATQLALRELGLE